MSDVPLCVVTGCAGFVGGHLTESLLGMGFAVAGVDDLSIGHDGNMASFARDPGFTFHEACVTESGLLTRLRARHQGLAHVFHLAAVVSVPLSMEQPERTMAVNLEATAALHSQARDLGLASFVFAGSAAEYGDDGRLPLAEDYADDSTRQLSPYGRSKYLATRLVRDSGFGVSLRCFNIYGPRQDPDSPYSGVISRFMGRVAAGARPVVLGDGGQTRDFVHIKDVLDAYLAAAGLHRTLRPAPPGVYNVGTGRGVSILELASSIMGLAGMEQEPEFAPARRGDIRHSVADVSRLKSAIGFEPGITLRQGLAQTLEWYRTG